MTKCPLTGPRHPAEPEPGDTVWVVHATVWEPLPTGARQELQVQLI